MPYQVNLLKIVYDETSLNATLIGHTHCQERFFKRLFPSLSLYQLQINNMQYKYNKRLRRKMIYSEYFYIDSFCKWQIKSNFLINLIKFH